MSKPTDEQLLDYITRHPGCTYINIERDLDTYRTKVRPILGELVDSKKISMLKETTKGRMRFFPVFQEPEDEPEPFDLRHVKLCNQRPHEHSNFSPMAAREWRR